MAGKDHRERIGLLGPTLTIEEARRGSAIMLVDVTVSERGDETSSRPIRVAGAPVEQVERRPSQTVTLRELADRYVRVHVDARLKPGTAERYRQQLRDVILPYRAKEDDLPLGDRDFRSVRRSEINEMVTRIKDTPGAANNALATTSSLYSWIIKDLKLRAMLTPPSASSTSR